MPFRSIAHVGVVEFAEERHDVGHEGDGSLASIRSITRQKTVQHYNLKRVTSAKLETSHVYSFCRVITLHTKPEKSARLMFKIRSTSVHHAHQLGRAL